MFASRIPLFSLLGFRVSLDLSWFLLAFLIVWSLSSGQFPRDLPGLDRGTYYIMGVAGALGLFASIVLHELAHAVVARGFGLPVGGITLFIFGGVAELQDEPQTPRTEFWVAIAGPIASVLIAVLCYFTALGSAGLALAQAATVFAFLAYINTVLALFNLIPAFPLDGGRILRALLWWRNGNLKRSTRIASFFGTAFGAILMAMGVVAIFTGNAVGGTWQLLIGFFLSGAASQARVQTELSEGLKNVTVARVMNTSPVTISPDATVQQLVDDYIYRYRRKYFIVVENGQPLGYVGPDEVKRASRAHWDDTFIRTIMKPLSRQQIIAPDATAREAIRRMEIDNLKQLVVTDGQVMRGLLTQRDILDFLSVRAELEENTEAGDLKRG
jgi:Zn-dependent protease